MSTRFSAGVGRGYPDSPALEAKHPHRPGCTCHSIISCPAAQH